MRHKVHGRKLGRTASHKRALMRNLCKQLITHESIMTTTAKAKELRRYIEPMITRAKNDTPFNRSFLFRALRSDQIIDRLFEEIAPRFTDRPGGYTRVIKLSKPRHGDNADMAVIELVEQFESDFEMDDEDEDEEKVEEQETKQTETENSSEANETNMKESESDKKSAETANQTEDSNTSNEMVESTDAVDTEKSENSTDNAEENPADSNAEEKKSK